MTNAKNTAYSVNGSGPPVVLVHGLGLNRHMWREQRASLESHFTVVTYDLLGHGESPDHGGEYRMHHMVDQLAELLDDLGIDTCGLVGFSLGGAIVQAFTLAHPERVNRLVVMATGHNRPEENRAAIRQRVRQARDHGPASTVDAALKRWFSPEFAEDSPEVMAQVREWITANDPDTYPRVYELLAVADVGLEESIAAIQCPTLVVTGEDDLGSSPEMAEAIADRIPNARAVILPRLRHMAMLEHPAGINALVVPFLQGVT